MADDKPLSIPILAIYGLIGITVVTIVFAIYTFYYNVFGNRVLTALSVFSAGASAFTSFLIVIFYIQQTNILSTHSELLEVQSELMEMQYIPRISVQGDPEFNDDVFIQDVENRGTGAAADIELHTHIEFENSEHYDSPLEGDSKMIQVNNNASFLEGHQEKRFEAECFLDVEGLSGEVNRRSFENIVSNLHDEGVSRIRVSLEIYASGEGDNRSECPALPEEYFYSDLERGDEFTLEERYRVSSPQ